MANWTTALTPRVSRDENDDENVYKGGKLSFCSPDGDDY